MNSTNNFGVFLVLAFTAMIGFNAYKAIDSISYLETATAKQCANHDWPAHQHQAHMDFCAEYGYPTN